MSDLLAIFDELPNKEHLWRMMRYMCLVYEFQSEKTIEIHKPRSSHEIFTYRSDRYWAKLLYGLSDKNSSQTILQRITNGSQKNLDCHWYKILKDNNYLLRSSIYYEVTFYIFHSNKINEDEKIIHRKIIEENIKLSKIVSYIINVVIITKETCEYLLRYFCKYSIINEHLINKFYEYMMLPPQNSCSEIEYRNDILLLVYKYNLM